jgi:hypothetical protein
MLRCEAESVDKEGGPGRGWSGAGKLTVAHAVVFWVSARKSGGKLEAQRLVWGRTVQNAVLD